MSAVMADASVANGSAIYWSEAVNRTVARAWKAASIGNTKWNNGQQCNGGLKWIQTGGGYYSECNKRLKG